MQRHGDEVDLTTDEARGGSTPHIVRYVLLISLFLAAAAMTIAWVTGALTSDQVRDNGAVTNQAVPPASGDAIGEEQAGDDELADDFVYGEEERRQAPADD
ncbi:MAG: hypothetical protein CL820_15420 [Croceicoccus sp.]|nr:hypothetical protein [Croceicoccus sp.]|tara:strand:+ start:265 stop:567 length:303 start_codon:yes stop_codon:yes gene_type:complete